ncbi:MAG: hypothetical protein IJ011_02190 [Clostridia bacterium]|nr:hypothetical protein [Clostridia bacterium]
MKKFFAIAVVVCMMTALIPLNILASDTEKTIDLYLIAGQSNAAGTTKVTDASAAYLWAPELRDGYSNVHYAGNSRSNSSGTRDRDLPWQKAALGLGISSSAYMGPEAGMAEALSAYYNEETGRNAGIIKYAFGGSSLLNDTTGSTHSDGNWVSPSYEATLSADAVVDGVTGKLYENFLAQVEKNISELEAYGGYTKVNICGLYWMQGCANRSNPTEYQTAFTYFATDIRNDLSALMKEYTGTSDDCGASEMPIVVGTLSQTQNLNATTAEETNKTFIEMQKSLATTVENCYVVDNSHFAISAVNFTDTTAPIVLGSDRWHWNQADMLEIGENVGNELLYRATGYSETATYAPLLAIDTDSWKTKLSGSDTEFEIGTASEFLSLFRYLNSNSTASLTANKTFKLTADIDLNPGVDWAAYNADPVGYDGVRPVNVWISGQFSGTLDGQGYSITGLWHEDFVRNSTSKTVATADGNITLKFSGMNSMGLLYLPKNGAKIQNLVLGGGLFHDDGAAGGCSVGSLIGCVSNAGSFEINNCYVGEDFTVDGRDSSNQGNAYGGIIGSNWSTTGAQTLTVRNVVFAGTVITPYTSSPAFGYMIGKAQKSGSHALNFTMTDCMFAGTLRGSNMDKVKDTLTRGTAGTPTEVDCDRNYTSQPTGADTEYLTATATYGVLPKAVAELMNAYYNRNYSGNNKQYADLVIIDTAVWAERLASDETEFEIGTASELMSLFRYLNQNATKALSSGKTFKLTADIDLNAGVDWAAYNADPEGYSGIRPANVWVSSLFWGTIDGQGHTIKGLWHENFMKNATVKTVETNTGTKTLSFSAMKSMGLVQEPKDGTVVRNLVIDGGYFHDFSTVGGCSMGAVIGCVSNGGTFAVENCYIGEDFTVDASDTPNMNHSFGGVIGSNWSTDSAQTLTVKNVVFDGTLVTPTAATPAFGYMIGKAQNSSSRLLNLTVTDCMFTGTLIGSRKTEVRDSMLSGTTNAVNVMGEERNYTSQPETADSQYLTKTVKYGVLPVVVADMLSSYFVQDNGTDTIRIISEVNSYGWDQIGYDVVITRTSDSKSLKASALTDVVFDSVLANGQTVTVDSLTDIEGVAIYGMVLSNLNSTETYTITVTPKWVDGENTVYGVPRVGTINIGS